MRQGWLLWVSFLKRYRYLEKWSTTRVCHFDSRSCCSRHAVSDIQSEFVSRIKEHTELTRKHLTPEIQLHLVTPNCDLWHIKGDNSPFPDPFWAFYWPGGQAVTRFILDNRDMIRSKHVLDIGCGCGATSIAAAQSGADKVLANDIDTVATIATQLNACNNGCKISVSSQNLIGAPCYEWDVIILGDMFYDNKFAAHISDWLKYQVRKDTLVLIGDPGRLPFMNHPMKSQLVKLMEYELPEDCKHENNGMTSAAVWRFCQFP